MKLTKAQRTAARIARQREKLVLLDRRIGELMTRRVDEEDKLAELLGLIPKPSNRREAGE